MNDVELLINGKIYKGWLSINITSDLKAICPKFSLAVTSAWTEEGKKWSIAPHDKCSLRVNKKIIITGYIDTVNSNFAAGSRTITVSGRGKAGDLVDCCYEGPTVFKDLKLESIVKKLCAPFGINVKVQVDTGAPFKNFTYKIGESVFEAINRAAKARGIIFTSDGQGDILATKTGAHRRATALIEGENLVSASLTFDGKNRFSKYIVKGQSKGSDDTWGAAAAKIEGHSDDKTVTRYRPLVMTASSNMDAGAAQIKAAWENTHRKSESIKFSVSLKGWFDNEGHTWHANDIVTFQSEYFGIHKDFLISSVALSYGENGGTTVLTLVSPDSFKAAPKKPSKKAAKDSQWEIKI